MTNLFQSLQKNLRKPLLFGVCGALGCLVAAAVFGEPFWELTKREKPSQTILLLIDTSQSMAGTRLDEVKAAAQNFVQRQLAREDLSQINLAVVNFGDDAQVVTRLTDDKAILDNAISSLDADGGTRMDLGLEEAIEELKHPIGENNTSHILLFTDGKPGGTILPKEITLLLDTSESMGDDGKLEDVQLAAQNFVERQLAQTNAPETKLAVLGFGNEVQEGTTLTSDQDLLREAIANLRISEKGGTRMDLGIQSAIEQFDATTDRPAERNILLFTDGQPTPEPPPVQVDVMFVLDTTGSMHEEINGVRQGIQSFVNELNAKNFDAQIGLIDFRDRFEGEEPKVLSFDSSVFTKDTESFSREVGKLSADGGGVSNPESSFDALALATRQDFRPGAKKVILLITDAPPLIPDREIASVSEMSNLLRSSEIDQLHFAIHADDSSAYEKLQETVPGEVFPLAETPLERSEFDRVLPLLGEQIAETAIERVDRQPTIDATLLAGETAREQEINIIAVGTGDAESSFLTQLTGDNPESVFYTEDSSKIDQILSEAEKYLIGSDDFRDVLADTRKNGSAAKNQNINIVAVGAGEADQKFLNELTGNSELVFAAQDGQFDEAFKQAENSINFPIDQEQGDYTLPYAILRLGGWASILAWGLSLALMASQNHYLRRRHLSFKELGAGTLGSAVAGMVGGSLGQITFTRIIEGTALATTSSSLLPVIVAWGVLGTLVGGGMSFFVPNLKKYRAVLGGGIGGTLGGIGFQMISHSLLGGIPVGVFQVEAIAIGRLAGSAIIGFCVGVMVALMEILSREARLIIKWTPQEKRELLLGSRPIIFGSSDESDIYLSKKEGYPPTTAKIFKDGDKIVMLFDKKMDDLRPMRTLRHELKAGERRRLGGVTFEVKIASQKSGYNN